MKSETREKMSCEYRRERIGKNMRQREREKEREDLQEIKTEK